MDMQALLIFVIFLVWAWFGTRAKKIESAANRAIATCEEEIVRLRRGILASGAEWAWQEDFYERSRLDVLSAIQNYREVIGAKCNPEIEDAALPSFQRQSDRERFGP